MNAIVEINVNNPQGRQFLQYARTLPFAKVVEDGETAKSTWQQALDDGAVTVDQFVNEAKRQIKEHFKNA